MRNGKKKINVTGVLLLLLLLLLATVCISIFLGRYPISPAAMYGILASKFTDIKPFWTPVQESLLLLHRLPRIALACLVGCSLSAAGAAYQGVFQNPMASPDILGASSGAALGAALAILLNFHGNMIILFSFFFSLCTVLLVLFLGNRVRGKQFLGLILAGIMISSLVSSATSFVKMLADPSDQLPAITYWLMGSLNGAVPHDVIFAVIPMAVGLVPLLLLRWRINILTFGDTEAKTMGVDAEHVRVLVILCATLITAASVSVSGIIGWVGLVIPHFARRLTGNNYIRLLPASMLMGASFLLIVDNLSRNLLMTEIPIGILTSFIGAPFFIYIMMKEGNPV